MNILFIVPSYKPAFIYGGPIVVISRLAEYLVKAGHTVTVYTTTANGKEELDIPVAQPMNVEGVTVYYFKRNTGDHTHASFSLWLKLWKTAPDFEVVHIHSWWNFLVVAAAAICSLKKIRPVLTPHGMFSTYILSTNNSLPKKILHGLLGKRLLKKTILHVSTQLELKESFEIIAGWENMVVPNLIELPAPGELTSSANNSLFTIGFLSRVDPKKGLDILMKSLAKVSFPFCLQIAGDGDPAYVESLKQLSKQLGIDHQVQWVGWKSRAEKFQFFAGLDLFALTSHSENFAVVVLESLVAGTPVLVSEHVGLAAYVAENSLGWVSSIDTDAVADKLELLFNARQQRKEISTTGPALIRKHFDDATLAAQYVSDYQKYFNQHPKLQAAF